MTNKRKKELLATAVFAVLILTLIVAIVSCERKDPAIQNGQDDSSAAQEGGEQDGQYADGELGSGDFGHYRNQVIEFSHDGITYTIGTDTDEDGYLYLNPTCDAATINEKIGFWIVPSDSVIEYSNEKEGNLQYWDKDYLNFVFAGSTQDHLIPSEYESADSFYGTKWRHDTQWGSLEPRIYFRVENLKDEVTIDAFYAEIGHDETTDTYYISDVQVNDARNDPDADAEKMIMLSAEALSEDDQYPESYLPEDMDPYSYFQDTAIIERVPRIMTSRLMSCFSEGYMVPVTNVSTDYLYAVHLTYDDTHYGRRCVTYYCNGIKNSTASDMLNFYIQGYEPDTYSDEGLLMDEHLGYDPATY